MVKAFLLAITSIGTLRLGGTQGIHVAADNVRSLSAQTPTDRVNLRNLDTPDESRTFVGLTVQVF